MILSTICFQNRCPRICHCNCFCIVVYLCVALFKVIYVLINFNVWFSVGIILLLFIFDFHFFHVTIWLFIFILCTTHHNKPIYLAHHFSRNAYCSVVDFRFCVRLVQAYNWIINKLQWNVWDMSVTKSKSVRERWKKEHGKKPQR